MTSPRITLTYSGGAAVVDPWWVRLEQENLPDDTATISDAADLLDTLYQLDPCADETEAPPDPAAEEVTETVELTVDRVACRFDADGNVDVDLRVIRSRQDAPYKLALQGGELQTTETIREPITRVVQIDSADRHTLDYPVVDGFSAEWRGTVYGSQGRIDPPKITRSGNTIAFAAEVKRGSIAVSYITEYDRCTVTILGIDGEPGECTARAFFHGLVDELPLEIPEAAEPIGACTARWVATPVDYQIDCYREVTISTRCQCTDKEVRTLTYEESVPCPEEVVRCQGVATECRHLVGSVTVPEYVECADDREIPGRPGTIYALSTAKYYEDHCCKAPAFALPQCPEKTITHRGGLPLQGGSQPWIDIWGPKLRITPISPPGGICGNWTIRQEVRSSNCCDGVDPLVWDTETSPEVMSPNSSAIIGVIGGGRYPYEWTVAGQGFQFQNGSKKITTVGNRIYLAALPTACGTASITVSDGCTTVTVGIRCTQGKWVGGFIVDAAQVAEIKARYGVQAAGHYLGVIDGSHWWEAVSGGTWIRQGTGVQTSFYNCSENPFTLCDGLYAFDPSVATHYSWFSGFNENVVPDTTLEHDHCFWQSFVMGGTPCKQSWSATHQLHYYYEWVC